MSKGKEEHSPLPATVDEILRKTLGLEHECRAIA